MRQSSRDTQSAFWLVSERHEKHNKFEDVLTVFRDDVTLFDPKEKPLRRTFLKDL